MAGKKIEKTNANMLLLKNKGRFSIRYNKLYIIIIIFISCLSWFNLCRNFECNKLYILHTKRNIYVWCNYLFYFLITLAVNNFFRLKKKLSRKFMYSFLYSLSYFLNDKDSTTQIFYTLYTKFRSNNL